jgi:hypothetical protein
MGHQSAGATGGTGVSLDAHSSQSGMNQASSPFSKVPSATRGPGFVPQTPHVGVSAVFEGRTFRTLANLLKSGMSGVQGEVEGEG